MSNTIKRKVKPLEWFEENCIFDKSLDAYIYHNMKNDEFSIGMVKYCGKEIQINEYGVCDFWDFSEWMLEPLEENNIDKLWSVLSDEIIMIKKYNDTCGNIINCYDSEECVVLGFSGFHVNINDGIYYRPNQEPKLKKIPLTAEDLDKRSDLRVKGRTRQAMRYLIRDYNFEYVYIGEMKLTYAELQESYTWLDNEGCWKYDK